VKVGGLDGCRGGWVLATLEVGDDAPPSVAVAGVDDFGEVLASVVGRSELAALAVDMPFGLPEDGLRAADRAARLRLGPRRSTIFPTPARATLSARDYPDALRISRRETGKGLSKQAFHLLPRIAEVDRSIEPDHQDRVFECHPELAFARLSGSPVLSSKHTPDGIAERIALLGKALGISRRSVAALVSAPPGRARPDDVVDALAIALLAHRFTTGQVEHLGDGARDRRGLRMEIVV
jgi:predicted RNase H-like nuclease